MTPPANRLRELDFLRGVAIILVLFRHQHLFQFTEAIGWVGVDLFFVLSGFLVSGLLFKEYIKFGNIKPGLFLIRRGFKIYPIYYLFYILYLVPILIDGKLNLKGLFADLFFVQNYVWGWGYAYIATWSLAIEEHFYFGLAMMLFYYFRNYKIEIDNNLKAPLGSFGILTISIMAACLVMRILSNIYFPEQTVRNFTMTHLRIDSLLTGVFVAYLFYFRHILLTRIFSHNKTSLLIASVLLLSFIPFISPEDSFFVKTFGFTFINIAFGIFLIYFLVDAGINTMLNRVFTRPVVDITSKIGFSSYSIYIIHTFINYIFALINIRFLDGAMPQSVMFFVTSIASIGTGMLMTYYIEQYFLNIRNRHYPARVN